MEYYFIYIQILADTQYYVDQLLDFNLPSDLTALSPQNCLNTSIYTLYL